MHLSVAIPEGSPGYIGRILADFFSLIFGPGQGQWTAFALPRQNIHGERPAGFVTSPPS